MSNQEAKALARKLRRQGRSLNEISDELARSGYLGRRTGKPLGISVISRMIKITRSRKSAGSDHPEQKERRVNKTDLVKTISRLAGVDASTRLALIELCMDL